MGLRGEIFSSKALTEKRTYFFNIKENRNNDKFMNIVESRKHGIDGFERHSIIVYQEDIEIFYKELTKAVDFLKSQKSRNNNLNTFKN